MRSGERTHPLPESNEAWAASSIGLLARDCHVPLYALDGIHWRSLRKAIWSTSTNSPRPGHTPATTRSLHRRKRVKSHGLHCNGLNFHTGGMWDRSMVVQMVAMRLERTYEMACNGRWDTMSGPVDPRE